jgi:hypothetical protein
MASDPVSKLRLDPKHKVGQEWLQLLSVWSQEVPAKQLNRASHAAEADVPPVSADPRINALNALKVEINRSAPYQRKINTPPEVKDPLVDSMFRAAANYLRAIGVGFREVPRTDSQPPRLEMGVQGSSALNQAAAALAESQGTTVTFSPDEVIASDAAASYQSDVNRLNIDLQQLQNPFKLTAAFMHERVHAMSWTAAAAGHPWPSSGDVWAQEGALMPEVLKGAPVYRRYQAFDEMPAHLTTVLNDLVSASQGSDREFRAKAGTLMQDIAWALDVTLRAEGMLRRSQGALERFPIQYVPQRSGTGMSLIVPEGSNPAHAATLSIPQPTVLRLGEETEQLVARTSIASTYVALARLAQSVMDKLVSEPDAVAHRGELVQALVPLFQDVLQDVSKGDIHYTFPEAVAQYNRSLDTLLAQSESTAPVSSVL